MVGNLEMGCIIELIGSNWMLHELMNVYSTSMCYIILYLGAYGRQILYKTLAQAVVSPLVIYTVFFLQAATPT